jgi:hypothetical protein
MYFIYILFFCSFNFCIYKLIKKYNSWYFQLGFPVILFFIIGLIKMVYKPFYDQYESLLVFSWGISMMNLCHFIVISDLRNRSKKHENLSDFFEDLNEGIDFIMIVSIIITVIQIIIISNHV